LGKTLFFAANALGTQPLRYQWYFNGNIPVNGAQAKTLSVGNTTASNAGDYTIVVTNLYGSTTSAVATLTFCRRLRFLRNPHPTAFN
jgi:immunoglobulin I-set domain protein